jgi:hypothetical protein
MGRKSSDTVSNAVIDAIKGIRDTKLYNGHWINEDVMTQLLQVDDNSTQILITSSCLRNTFSVRSKYKYVNDLTTANPLCIYKREKRKTIDTQYKRIYYFYFSIDSTSIPPEDTDWYSTSVNDLSCFSIRCSHRLNKHLQSLDQQIETQNKRHKTNRMSSVSIPTEATTNTVTHIGQINNETQQETQQVSVNEKSNLLSEQIKQYNKWDSPEALSLFVTGTRRGMKQRDKDRDIHDVKNHVRMQIRLLQDAYLSPRGWKRIVDDEDKADLCTSNDIYMLRLKSKYLAMTLRLALQYYEHTDNFLTIIEKAISKIDAFEYDDDADTTPQCKSHSRISRSKTIMEWLLIFRRSNSFPNPSRSRTQSWKSRLPFIFENNPDLHEAFLTYAKSNLNILSGQMLHSYLFDTAIPSVISKIKEARNVSDYSVADFLNENKLHTLTPRTIYNWLHHMGFKYSDSKKSYYVDSHEKPENVRYRSKFIDRYKTYELRCHRWIQIPVDRYERLVEKGELSSNCGYMYEDSSGNSMVELHVDDHPIFQKESNNLPYGGRLSVRKDPLEKPLMILGQDECIFKQFTLTTKSWTDPDGTRSLLPKDDGQGVMVSSFVCRELGFGYKPTPQQLSLVNAKRKIGSRKRYADEDAAIELNGTSSKADLKTSPFTRKLTYGANKDGYWSYEHMVVQLEDCLDVLQVLFPTFDFLFLFDHSNGHDRMQPRGLNISKISKNYGGKQPMMRDSTITDTTCFGPYHNRTYPLQLNGTQVMTFTDKDEGPFYLTPEQRERRKYDICTGKMIEKYYVKSRLVEMLQEMNIKNPIGSFKELQRQCIQLGLPVKYTEEKLVRGWANKAKGAFQVLYERGWIDPHDYKQYTEKGQVGDMGMVLEETSINMLMKKQSDFLHELTLLQYYGKKLGVQVDRTPKCHPEMAGEGIEYLWALAKLYYRYAPLSEKRTKKGFQELVDKCLSNVNLTLSRARTSSRRAREYMLVYKAFESLDIKQYQNTNNREHNSAKKENINSNSVYINYNLIEKSIKVYKTHRNAKDFDTRFIERLQLDKDQVSFVKDVVGKMKKNGLTPALKIS